VNHSSLFMTSLLYQADQWNTDCSEYTDLTSTIHYRRINKWDINVIPCLTVTLSPHNVVLQLITQCHFLLFSSLIFLHGPTVDSAFFLPYANQDLTYGRPCGLNSATGGQTRPMNINDDTLWLMLRELLSSVQMMFMRLNPLSHSDVLTGKDSTELMKRCIGPLTEAHRRSYH